MYPRVAAEEARALKNQEAESNERPAPGNNVAWRGRINDTPFYTFPVAERALRGISYRDKGVKSEMEDARGEIGEVGRDTRLAARRNALRITETGSRRCIINTK